MREGSPIIKRNIHVEDIMENDHHNIHTTDSSLESPLLRTRSIDSHPATGKSSPSRNRNSPPKASCFGTCRWILLGVILGSAGTAFLQSLHLPSMCINLSMGDMDSNPMNPLQQMEKERLQSKQQHNKEDLPHHDRRHHHRHQKLQSASNATRERIEEDQENPFVNLPPPPTLALNEAFSACLLIKDDNHWLIEWLAYHHFVMPLRYLIVSIDPDSKTSPRAILDRWSSRSLMDIRIWKEEDFMPRHFTAKAHMFDNNTGLMMHRVRQNNFFRKCIAAQRTRKHEWVMLVDTDEFILPSYASGHFRNLTTQVSFQETGSVLRLLKYHEQVAHTNHTCVYMPRFFFGAKPSRMELVTHAVPKFIRADNMLTQKFLFREPRRAYNGKNLVNTFRVPNLVVFGSVHHVAEACSDPDYERTLDQNKHALIRVHHYLGTPEQYLFRDDPRRGHHSNSSKPGSFAVRGQKRYDEMNSKAYHEDHAAKAWLRGFVKEMGENLATELLNGVGQVEYVKDDHDKNVDQEREKSQDHGSEEAEEEE
jgi:Glycosyltransferase family 92